MADIFISYKREERGQVERLATALRGLGLSVWFDASLSAGESFSDEIDREVRAALIVLVCWSPAAAGSQWVKAEAQVGFGKGNLVSTWVAGVDGFEPPVPYNSQHLEDLRSWTASPSHRDPAWRSILRRVGVLCGRDDVADWGALGSDASAAEIEQWFARHGAQSPLVIEAESLLRERQAASVARTEAEAAARERVARLTAEREVADAEARALSAKADADKRTAEADARAARAVHSASISRRAVLAGAGALGLGAAGAGVWTWRGFNGSRQYLRPLFPIAELTEAGRAAGIRDVRHVVKHALTFAGASAVRFNPNGPSFVVASGDDNAYIFSSEQEGRTAEIPHPSDVKIAAFHPRGLNFATASVHTAYIWSATGEPISTLTGHADHIDTLAYDNLGTRLLSACAGVQGAEQHDFARVWDTESGELRGTFAQPGGVSCVSFAPLAQGIATGSLSGLVYVRDYWTFTVRFTLDAGHVSVLSVGYHPDGERLLSITPNGIRLWEATTGAMISELEGTDNIRNALVSIRDARFSPSGAYIGCVIMSHRTGVPSRVRIWDVTPGGAVNQRDIEGDFRTIAFTSDSKTIVAGREDGAACLYATDTGALLATLRGHVAAPNVEADPNNLLLATYSGEDNFVHVWQIDGPA